MTWKMSKDDSDNDQLINLDQITNIFIGKFSDDNKDVTRVMIRYSSNPECLSLYNGTYVECIKVMLQLFDQLNAEEFDVWGENDE